MTRKESPPDALGLSAIDLISCAFIAVLLLNLTLRTTDENESELETKGLSLVQVELLTNDDSLRLVGIGMVLIWKGKAYKSWEPGSREVRWDDRGDGRLAALLSDRIKPGDVVVVPLLLDDPRPLASEANVLITSSVPGEHKVLLSADNYFVARMETAL